jgi:hypothetical protein
MTRICLALIGISVLLGAGAQETLAAVQPPGDPRFAYHEHTPSARAMERGRRAYRAGQHHAALAQFREAARWADKCGQFNVGVMYLRGEGTEFDPLRAWAWLELSAERGYPEMVETADQLFALMNESEQAAARQILEEELLPAFGDEVAVPRTTLRMRRDLRRATGSRLGAGPMVARLTIIDGTGSFRQGSEFYDPAKWDFRRIVEYETRLMLQLSQGGVRLGEFRVIEDEDPPAESREDEAESPR